MFASASARACAGAGERGPGLVWGRKNMAVASGRIRTCRPASVTAAVAVAAIVPEACSCSLCRPSWAMRPPMADKLVTVAATARSSSTPPSTVLVKIGRQATEAAEPHAHGWSDPACPPLPDVTPARVGPGGQHGGRGSRSRSAACACAGPPCRNLSTLFSSAAWRLCLSSGGMLPESLVIRLPCPALPCPAPDERLLSLQRLAITVTWHSISLALGCCCCCCCSMVTLHTGNAWARRPGPKPSLRPPAAGHTHALPSFARRPLTHPLSRCLLP